MSVCRTSGRFIFLDLDRDRYFGLDEEADVAFAALIDGRPPAPKLSARLEPLVARGILRPGPDNERPQVCLLAQPAASSMFEDRRTTGAAHEAITVLVLRLTSQARLRILGLRRTLDRFARAKRNMKPANGAGTPREVARAFAAASLIVQSRDRCLSTSIAVAHRLVSLGHPADLILGVKLRPFQAHCWVQSGPTLVNDHVDAVRSFTPILVV